MALLCPKRALASFIASCGPVANAQHGHTGGPVASRPPRIAPRRCPVRASASPRRPAWIRREPTQWRDAMRWPVRSDDPRPGRPEGINLRVPPTSYRIVRRGKPRSCLSSSRTASAASDRSSSRRSLRSRCSSSSACS